MALYDIEKRLPRPIKPTRGFADRIPQLVDGDVITILSSELRDFSFSLAQATAGALTIIDIEKIDDTQIKVWIGPFA